MYSVLSDVMDSIKGWFQSLLENLIYWLLYLLESLILRFVALVEDMMMIFTGEREVSYNTKKTTLIDVFFNHESIRGIYTGIAIIGIIFAFAFAVIAVIRKIGDLRGKQQGVTLGTIIGNLLKSILLIVGMNAIILLSIGTANILTNSVSDAIRSGRRYLPDNNSIVFTDEQYASMGRIINTLGNYSLNPSYRSRYNLNACYNDIRADLQKLGDQGVFNFHYVTKDAKNRDEVTWQSLMEELGTAYDYTREAPLDSYDDGLTNAILDCMEILKANKTLRVLESYNVNVELTEKESGTVPMDRIVFLVGTMGTIGNEAAARNDAFNVNPSFFDSVRQPFYTGEKSIYSWDQVKTSFNPSPAKMNYILVYAIAIALLMEMLVIILTCAVRIFNLLALYIASPLAIAAMPLDDGGKFRQWITAFVVQLLGVVGMVLSMRLLLMFLPIIWSPSLSISKYSILDCIVKAVITYGGMTGVNKVNGIFTGILADNAGYQAILAGDVRDKVQNSGVGRALNSVSAGNIGSKVAGKVGGAVGAVGTASKNFAGKWAGKAAEATGLASVGRSIRGVAEAAGFVKEHDKSTDPEHVQHARERGRQRDMRSLQADIDYAGTHGTHRDGSELKKGELRQMQHTLHHMQNGNHTLSQAKKLAKVDMAQDLKDAEREGRERASELPNNQRNNQNNPGGQNPPPPNNQNNNQQNNNQRNQNNRQNQNNQQDQNNQRNQNNRQNQNPLPNNQRMQAPPPQQGGAGGQNPPQQGGANQNPQNQNNQRNEQNPLPNNQNQGMQAPPQQQGMQQGGANPQQQGGANRNPQNQNNQRNNQNPLPNNQRDQGDNNPQQ